MATRTAINTSNNNNNNNNNIMRGISIIIDQDPSRQQQNDDQRSKIPFHQKTTTTTTAAAPVEVSALQRMSPELTSATTTTTSTLIDINRNNGDLYNHIVDRHDNDDDYADDDHHRRNDNETGYTTAIRGIFPTVQQQQQLMLMRAARDDASERGKLKVAVGKALEHVTTNTTICATTIGVHERKSRAYTSCESRNGISADHDVAMSGHQTMIIECNNRDDYASVIEDVQNGNRNEVNDEDDDDRESGEESRNYGASSVGQCLGGSGSTSPVELELKLELALENVSATTVDDSRATKADCASALTATEATEATTRNSRRCASNENAATTHVVKIRIQNGTNESNESRSIALSKLTAEKQVTVVQLNKTLRDTLPSEGQCPGSSEFVARARGEEEEEENEISLLSDKMVQNRTASAAIGHSETASGGGSVGVNSGGTTVTELNVSNQSYLYYMMSSGQFSPCETLDSGTGSDLESNGHPSGTHQTASGSGGSDSATVGGGVAPKLELHLKTTKVRITNMSSKGGVTPSSSAPKKGLLGEGCARAGSLTDSEESESSSLSCDSLHSTEFMRQSSVSPMGNGHGHGQSHITVSGKGSQSPDANGLGAFLPDSLLRDIRDRKFPTNDFEAKYAGQRSPPASVHEQDLEAEAERQDSFAFIQQHNSLNSSLISGGRATSDKVDKRASAPSKTFVLNTSDGSFVDIKMNAMPRTYEADKYYNFHVNEHENFRSFGLAGGNGAGDDCQTDDTASLSEFDEMQMHMNEDVFAGYKDIRCGSAASTIRSSKGTVRGVKNRVRNGIATFLQLQQPNVKNYKEKDLGKVVLYTTSMGIIRDTYAKCSNMKQILRTLLVKFEERDVFMSVEYQAEIKERMHSEAIRVPQLFVEGQHIGDAETVERLNESGELRQLLKPYKSIATTYTCQTCGGYRLLPCPSCNGSKKSVHRNHFTAEFVALKCMNCDEVGLVKCHNC